MDVNENNNSEELKTISLGNIPDNTNNGDMSTNVIPPVNIPEITPLEPVQNIPPINDSVSEPLMNDVAKENNEVNLEDKKAETEGEVLFEREEVKPEPVSTDEAFANVDIPPVFDGIGTVPPVASEPIPPVPLLNPVDYEVPNTLNTGMTEPIFNDIGTVPPIPDAPILTNEENNKNKRDKKPVNKLIFTLIIVLVMAGVGVAVYVLLGMAKTNGGSKVAPLTVKEVEIELGSEISTVITDYATFNTISSDNCSLNTSQIGNNLNEEYSFIITCNGINYNGKAKVIDTKAPLVELKEVITNVNGEVKPEDFIQSCDDATECSYEFKNAADVKELLKTVGIYKNQVIIIVKDTSGNTKEVNASLIVGEESDTANVHLICTKNTDTLKEVDKIGILDGNVVGSIIREYTFSFPNDSLYKAAKGDNLEGSDMTYQDITGKVSFDDTAFKFTITKMLSYEELNAEAGQSLSKSFINISYYFGGKGYGCELK